MRVKMEKPTILSILCEYTIDWSPYLIASDWLAIVAPVTNDGPRYHTVKSAAPAPSLVQCIDRRMRDQRKERERPTLHSPPQIGAAHRSVLNTSIHTACVVSPLTHLLYVLKPCLSVVSLAACATCRPMPPPPPWCVWPESENVSCTS